MDRVLQESNQYKRDAGVREVIERLTVLRDAWREMLQRQPETEALLALKGLSVVG